MQTIRKIQFIFTGYRNFTKQSKKLPPLQGTLKDINYVITGANSGIGLEAAIQAAQKKANVFLVCRNQKRGKEAVENIKKKTGNENVYLILGQIGEKKDMQSIMKQIQQKVGKIDILVHNAGCMINTLEYNSEHVQKNFASNTFGIYYLTKLCLDLLHEESKVITVSSGGMLTQPLQSKDLYMANEKFDGTTQYARNKRQQVCLMEYFARNYKNKGKFISMHPGWVDTQAVRNSMPDFYAKMKDDLRDPQQGADTITYLSLLPFKQIKNGEFYFDRKVADKHLTIARTGYSDEEVDNFAKILDKFCD